MTLAVIMACRAASGEREDQRCGPGGFSVASQYLAIERFSAGRKRLARFILLF
jgi:hypothetical protein